MRESVYQARTDPAAKQTGERELARVESEIRDIVLGFCRQRLFDTFRMDELTEYVRLRTSVAPDSPGRILRQLRRDNTVDYILVSRRESLYSITAVHDTPSCCKRGAR